MRKLVFAMALSVVFGASAEASVYDLNNVLGREVVGNGPFLASFSVQETSPGFATPYYGYYVTAFNVYFSDVPIAPNPFSNPTGNPSAEVDVTVTSGPDGPTFSGSGGGLTLPPDSYLYSQSVFAHSAGDIEGLPQFRFLVTVPDNVFIIGAKTVPVPPGCTVTALVAPFGNPATLEATVMTTILSADDGPIPTPVQVTGSVGVPVRVSPVPPFATAKEREPPPPLGFTRINHPAARAGTLAPITTSENRTANKRRI